MLNALSHVKGLSSVRQAKGGVNKALAVREELKTPIRKTADVFDVAKSTLQRAERAKAEGREIGKTGRPKKVSPEIEKLAVQYCLEQEKIGFPLSKMDLKDYVRHPKDANICDTTLIREIYRKLTKIDPSSTNCCLQSIERSSLTFLAMMAAY